jgi:quercetin dioxygenase-like cupin family protein
MKKVELKDVKPYDPPKHFKMAALKLHDKETTGSSNFMGLSHFLPGGGADWDEGKAEKIYFVLEGEVTIKTKKEEIILKPHDSIYIGPGEGREIINNTNMPASMLVFLRFPD